MNKNYSLDYDENIPKIVHGWLAVSDLTFISPKNTRIVGRYAYFCKSALLSLDFCPLIICDEIWV
jgi:hypothetical protein